MQLVGYTAAIGAFAPAAWIVRNSWGSSWWGEEGYIRLEFGSDACLITYMPSYVLLGEGHQKGCDPDCGEHGVCLGQSNASKVCLSVCMCNASIAAFVRY